MYSPAHKRHPYWWATLGRVARSECLATLGPLQVPRTCILLDGVVLRHPTVFITAALPFVHLIPMAHGSRFASMQAICKPAAMARPSAGHLRRCPAAHRCAGLPCGIIGQGNGVHECTYLRGPALSKNIAKWTLRVVH